MFSVCDYSNFYIFFKETITFRETAAVSESNDIIDEKVMFENCAPLNNCISRIKNTQEDDVRDIDVVIPMHNLIQYSDNYSKLLEFYGSIVEMNRLQMVIVLFLILLLLNQLLIRLKLKIKLQEKQGTMAQKKLK